MKRRRLSLPLLAALAFSQPGARGVQEPFAPPAVPHARAGAPPQDDSPSRDDARSDFFDAKGVKLHYLVQGAGEPVVLLHGLHSSALVNWDLTGVVAALAKDHRVVALDLRGHGRSEKPTADDAYGVQVVEDVVLLLDHLKLQKVQVVGYSLGGMVALKLAVLHPDRVSACLLGGMGWLREGSMLQRLWAKLPASDESITPPAFVHHMGELAVTAEQVKKVAIPVEVVVGDRDPVKRLYVEPLQRLRPEWPVVEVGDAGHVECVTRKAFVDEIGRWVRANDPPQQKPKPRRI